MLGVTPAYRNTLRNYVIAFGSIFDDITIQRKDSAGAVKQTIKVPLSYGPTQKYLSRVGVSSTDNEVAILLPRMSFEMNNFSYDPSRKRNKLSGIRKANNTDNLTSNFVYNPVPYDVGFTLSIMVKNAEDGTQILEQILPFFAPSFIIPIKELSGELDLVADVPLVLDGVDMQDDYEGDYLTRRALIWSLSFTLKGQVYGSKITSNIITSAITNTYDTSDTGKTNALSTATVPNDFGFGETLP
jgi:hypothetical protein